ncbi:MAG: hypothetical protein GX228_04525 [Firmicutes bacterium]|nr:BTAD domain-containing putative transcriptional regulator [Bacillota bacterium]NLL88187.1 hypothetical protein [Bacillota bacterium]
MTVIKVWFLGSFQVEVDGNCIPVVDWRSKKALTLFKYLSSHPGKKIPRDRLIELLWSNSDPESSIHNLHTTVYNLRRSLFPKGKKGNNHSVISYCNGLYWFDPPDGFYTDVFDFQSMTKTGYELDCVDPDEALSVYLQTLAIYRGDFLEEDLYEDWTIALRTNLREQYIEVALRTAELLVERRRDFNQAIQVCRNALNYDSTREKLHQAIIKYLLEQGRNVDAILQFKECVKILEDEVGLEPSEETCMLIQRLKNAANSGAETGNTARITDRFSVQRALKKGGELLLLFVTAPRHLEENKVLNYLANSLRQGDLICKWDQNHIGIYLNATDSVGVKVVSKRLEQGLHSEFADCKLVVRCVDSSQKNYTLMPTKALGWMGSD